MIAKGNTHTSGVRLARYLIRESPGERIERGEVRGFASEDIVDAFRSVDAMAEGTRGEKPLFHVQVRNPAGEHLSPEQWNRVADRIEDKLGLTDQPRAIVFHIDEETGDRHMHVAWSRIDDETMTLKQLPFYKLRLKEVCRELENEMGLTQVPNERDRKTQSPERDEFEEARRLGVDIHDVREKIRDCWERSDNGRSFQVALEFEGFTLAKGDHRDFIVLDADGGMHALGARILGVSAAEVRERCHDIDRASLPTVEHARAEQRTGMRDQHAANLAWEDALADAAISNEKANPQFDEPTARYSIDHYERMAPALLDELTRNKATFTRYDVERALAPEIENKTDRQGLARAIVERPDVVRLDAGYGKAARYTTPSVIASENHALRAADGLARHDWHDVPRHLIEPKLKGLTSEKADALRHILDPGGLSIIDGQAGTGKSSVLAAGKEIYEAHGCRVIGLAHTNLVVQDLKDRGFAARTIDGELFALSNGRTQWTARTVVMVDEAAMVDTRRLGMILSHAQASGAKVVLAGDDRQLSSIERGGLFEVLKNRHGAAELTEVHRQQATDDRAASRLMANGDFAGALAIYQDKNAIHWTAQKSEAAQALVGKYMQDTAADPARTRFIFAYTNDEVNQINAVVREARKERSELGESFSFETKHGKAEFAVGDRLQFTGTDKLRGIYNGQAGNVKKIDGTRLVIELDGRKSGTVEFDASSFPSFRHGYAGTIYRGQGRTIDQTYLLHSEYWRSASSYVALTRHSEKAELFVARETAPGLSELTRQMSRLDDRRAASFYNGAAVSRERPLGPSELAAWYANEDNCSRQNRENRLAMNDGGTGAKPARGNAASRVEFDSGSLKPGLKVSERDVRDAFAEVARDARSGAGGSAKAVAGAFGRIANALANVTSALAGGGLRSPQTPEEAQARRDAVHRRIIENAEAESRRVYKRQRDIEATELGERTAEEEERKKKRSYERQR